jgi:tetratricopeptide (TPR) repeat protein
MRLYQQRRTTILLVVAFFACSTISAVAQIEDGDRAACADRDPQKRIRACTALLGVIQAGDINTSVAYNNRGSAYSETGQQELAVQDFDQAIAIFPAYAIAFSNRGLAYENMGKLEQAMGDFDKALDLKPGYGAAYNNRCYVRALLGQLNDAVTDCQKALALEPNDPKTMDSMAFVYLKLGQYQQAIMHYNAALTLSPDLVESRYGRGLALIKSGDASGNNDVEAAVRADPKIASRMAAVGLTR